MDFRTRLTHTHWKHVHRYNPDATMTIDQAHTVKITGNRDLVKHAAPFFFETQTPSGIYQDAYGAELVAQRTRLGRVTTWRFWLLARVWPGNPKPAPRWKVTDLEEMARQSESEATRLLGLAKETERQGDHGAAEVLYDQAADYHAQAQAYWGDYYAYASVDFDYGVL